MIPSDEPERQPQRVGPARVKQRRRKLGRYLLGRPVGRGGMATVYEAKDVQLGRTVAVKVLDVPDYPVINDMGALIGRMRREARAAGSLSHPNIVSVLDTGEEDGLPYLVMEYLDGMTLRQRLDRDGPLPPAEAAGVLTQIARGLDAAHAQGLLHRDIKPSNIMLLPGGTPEAPETPHVKLMDFGVARQIGDTMMTRTGMMVGSPAYMAPETIRGEEATPAADVWATGALLYEMLAGKPPFDAPVIATIFYQILNQSPAPPAGVNPAVRNVLCRALEKNPSRRFATAGEMAAAFAQAIGADGAASPVRWFVIPTHRRPAAVAVSALLSVASVAAFLIAGAGPRSSRGSTGGDGTPVLAAPATTPAPPLKAAAPAPPRGTATVAATPPRPQKDAGQRQSRQPVRTAAAPAPPVTVTERRPPRPAAPRREPSKSVRPATRRVAAADRPPATTRSRPQPPLVPKRQVPPPQRVQIAARPETPASPRQRQDATALLERKVRLARDWRRLREEAGRVNRSDPAAVEAYNRKVYAFRRVQEQFNADVRRVHGGGG